MVIIDIDHIQIAAPRGCEVEARRFFGEVLGLEEIEKPEPLRSRGGCWFRVGSRQLHIGVQESFRPASKAHPGFGVSDVDSLFAKLEHQGVHCQWDEALAGFRRFYADDPWGNRFEFTEQTFRLERAKQRVEAREMDMSGSTFRDVNMAGAVFEDVNLAGATMNDVSLSGLRIGDANLVGMTIDGIPVAELMAAYRSLRP